MLIIFAVILMVVLVCAIKSIVYPSYLNDIKQFCVGATGLPISLIKVTCTDTTRLYIKNVLGDWVYAYSADSQQNMFDKIINNKDQLINLRRLTCNML